MEKICKRCETAKNLSDFKKKKSGKFGITAICKSCEKKIRSSEEYRSKERSRINANTELKEKRNKDSNLWKKKNKSKNFKTQKNWFLKKLYGITLEQYNLMFTSQEGKCAICERHQSILQNSLAVDHNHDNGEIRKLLCSDCNTALGLAKENPDLLIKMAEYINSYKEKK